MNRTETPAEADPGALLTGHVTEPAGEAGTSCLREGPDAMPDQEGLSDRPEGSSCGSADGSCGDVADDVAARERGSGCAPRRRVSPIGLTAAEVGAYFAAQVVSDAEEAARATARLGPKRVLALLE